MRSSTGKITLITFIEITLGILVGVFFLIAASSIGNPFQLSHFAIAKDVALLVDVTQATPYDVHYEYPETSYGSLIELSDEKVSVYTDQSVVQDSALTLSDYSYEIGTDYVITSSLLDGAFFSLEKQGKSITLLNKTREEEFSGQNDVVFYEKNDVVLSLVIDPEASFQDSLLLNPLESALTHSLSSKGYVLGPKPTLTIVLSLDEISDTLYYSDFAETTRLATSVHLLLEAADLDAVLVEGRHTLTEDIPFIELSLGPDYQAYVQDSLSVFTTFIVGGFDETFQ